VLSRVAESLYWIGRYVERAEDTARLLDVHVHTLLEDPWVDETKACCDLLGVMGVPVPEGPPVNARRTVQLLGFAPNHTSSIVGALGGARENARGVREAISSELWESVNATYHSLRAQESDAARRGPFDFFRYVRERSALISGTIDGTMPRDDGWRFLVLGRSLERIDMTARLLWARGGSRATGAGWTALLKSCSAHEAYLRTYRAAVEPERVVEFLVLDRLFPRSIYASMLVAEQCLAELDPTAGRTGVDNAARRLVGPGPADLEFRLSDELLADLPALLDRTQATCSAVGDAVSSRFFHRGAALAWAAGR
jgi:uncharacterized alpha-E superfamily protein